VFASSYHLMGEQRSRQCFLLYGNHLASREMLCGTSASLELAAPPPLPQNLRITDCSDLTCGSTDLVQCISSLETPIVEDCKNGIVALQERLGDLTSLTGLELRHCNGIKSLLESIQQLRCLRRLVIMGCPELVQWVRIRGE